MMRDIVASGLRSGEERVGSVQEAQRHGSKMERTSETRRVPEVARGGYSKAAIILSSWRQVKTRVSWSDGWSKR
jgi:hypothetical protein